MMVGPSLRRQMESRLAAFTSQPVPSERSLRHAAVALVVVGEPEAPAHLLLTRRPLDVPRHPGQYALPGGRLEPGEGTSEAARRELEEELGLETRPEDELGRLDDFVTRSGWRITPVVLFRPSPPPLRPDPREVAVVLHVPLRDLEGDVVHEEPTDDPARPILWLDVLGDRVFAPTAAMMLQFREVCLHGRGTRVAHYEQPRFAWR